MFVQWAHNNDNNDNNDNSEEEHSLRRRVLADAASSRGSTGGVRGGAPPGEAP